MGLVNHEELLVGEDLHGCQVHLLELGEEPL
jgi:hypothetical protein